jgi:hypothetical protein
MSSFIHQIDLPTHGQVEVQIHSKKQMISDAEARRIVNMQLVRQMGLLIITGNPQLLINQAKGILCWQVPFLVQPPLDDKKTYPTGEYASVDAYSGEYILDEEAIQSIRKAASPIIDQLYPDMDDYVQKIKKMRKNR